jgi:hypothetical protein
MIKTLTLVCALGSAMTSLSYGSANSAKPDELVAGMEAPKPAATTPVPVATTPAAAALARKKTIWERLFPCCCKSEEDVQLAVDILKVGEGAAKIGAAIAGTVAASNGDDKANQAANSLATAGSVLHDAGTLATATNVNTAISTAASAGSSIASTVARTTGDSNAATAAQVLDAGGRAIGSRSLAPDSTPVKK